jgi:hypothetical protein
MNSFSERLASVDWQALNASYIARWLADLASDDRSVRLGAYNNLEAKVIDIGSESWESYGPIKELLTTDVPLLLPQFLIQLLEDTSVQGKENILMLLTDLANKIYLDIDKLKSAGDRTKAYRIYEAVQKGIPLYQRLYETSDDKEVKQAASELLHLLGKDSIDP